MLGNLLYSKNRLKPLIVVTSLGLITNIMLNLIFIPIFGKLGASIAHIGTEASILLVWFYLFKKDLLEAFKKEHFQIIAINLAAILLILGFNLLTENPIRLFASFILFGTIYFYILKVFKIFDGFNIIKNIISPPKS